MNSLIISPPPTALDSMIRDSLFNTVSGPVRDASERYRRKVLQTLCVMKLPNNSKVQVNTKFADQSTEVAQHWTPEEREVRASNTSQHEKRELQQESINVKDQVTKKSKTEGGSLTLSSHDGKLIDALAICAAGIGTILVAAGTKSVTFTATCAGFTASLAYKYYKRYLRSDGEDAREAPLCMDASELSDSAIDGLLCGLTVNAPVVGIAALGAKYYLTDATFSSSINSFATSGVKEGLRKLSMSAFNNPLWIILPIIAFIVRKCMSGGHDKKVYSNVTQGPVASIRGRLKWFKSFD